VKVEKEMNHRGGLSSRTHNSSHLNPPLGGELVNLLATSQRRFQLRAASRDWPSWNLTSRQLCDLELLLNGGFSPLRGFMGQADYESVCSSMRLSSGLLWPIPVTLDVCEELAKKLQSGSCLALRDPEGLMLAALSVEEVWQPDQMAEAEAVFGTTSRAHPGVASLLDRVHPWYVAGQLEGVQLPVHYDFRHLRQGPAELRKEFSQLGWCQVLAFQTRNPMHRAHLELTWRAAREADANLLIHASVGMTDPGDANHYTRVRCYQALLAHYPPGAAKLALLPLALRMGGPREALWHAIIHKNYSCTHFVVGPDYAGSGSGSNGGPLYGPYDAHELLRKHQDELGVKVQPFRNMVYLEDRDQYVPEDEVPPNSHVKKISETALRLHLAKGREIPQWFTSSVVAKELQRTYPPRQKQGFTIFLTGLSGAGKSTIANVLLVKFLERGDRRVTLLDGDLVRKHLSSELGFSKEHRDLNIRRIGFVASEVTKNGGIAICAPIAPYDSTRKEVRDMVEKGGGFVLVHVATPIEICERRDRKGLYAKARAGKIQQFTGISDPYQVPNDAEVEIDTTKLTPEEAAEKILAFLEREGYVRPQEVAVEMRESLPQTVAANNGHD
jgi:sulfate adenylyltransferase